ncbi:hypothetical protein PQR64_30195 [Paraburkholderia phytofirmans]|uniref:hypothetical protein n=1 Tax=Paraburkholderia phytofirmans TaxID=261302 RepID=UPI0038B82570
MAVLAIPLVEGAGALLAEAFPALLGGTAAAGILSLSGDQAQDKSKTQPVARTMPKTDEACKKCPPDAGIFLFFCHLRAYPKLGAPGSCNNPKSDKFVSS